MNAPASTRGLGPCVELHIGELVLHGFSPGDRHPIREAMQTELERLFAERGLPHAWTGDSERPQLDGGEFRLTAHPRAETVGRQIAESLFSSLAANPRRRSSPNRGAVF